MNRRCLPGLFLLTFICAQCSREKDSGEGKAVSASTASQIPTEKAPEIADLETLKRKGAAISPQGWLDAFVKTKEPAGRCEIVRLSAVVIPQGAAEVIRKALRDPEIEVRRDALSAAFECYSELHLDEAFLTGLQDSDEETRKLALDRIGLLEKKWHVPVYAKALELPLGPEILQECIQGLGRLNTKSGVQAILNAAPRLPASAQTQCLDAVSILLNVKFATLEESSQWWNQNSASIDENLVKIN